MRQLHAMKPGVSATPWIIALCSPIFQVGWRPIFPLNFVRWVLRKAQRRSSQSQGQSNVDTQAFDLQERERGERLIEGLVLFFCVFSLVAFVALAAWHSSCGPFPRWLRVVAYVLAVVGVLRVLETFLIQTNVLIFDAYVKAEQGILHSVRGYYRLVVLLVINYLEALFWFAVAYLTLDTAWSAFGGAFQESQLTALYFSFFNLSSFGEALVGGVKPTGFLASPLVAYQGGVRPLHGPTHACALYRLAASLVDRG